MICPLILAAIAARRPLAAEDKLTAECPADCAWLVVSYPNGTTQKTRIARCALHWLADAERARWERHGSEVDRYEESH